MGGMLAGRTKKGCSPDRLSLPQVYMRARHYDPTTQRFISRDPIGLYGGVNLYAYCANDPASAIDPTGLKFCLRGSKKDIGRFMELLRKLTCLDFRLDNKNCIEVTGRHCPCQNTTLENELLNSQTKGAKDVNLNVTSLLENYMPSPGLYRDKNDKKLNNHTIQMDVFDALANAKNMSDKALQGLLEHELSEARDAVEHGRWGMSPGNYNKSHEYGNTQQEKA